MFTTFRCHRCGTETTVSILSMFNTQLLCVPCKDKEEQHPSYKAACEAERSANAVGNYNFPGIGLPDDLK